VPLCEPFIHWHFLKLSNAAGAQVPLAQVVPDVQYAPAGARQLPPVQAVPIGQSAAVMQVSQLPLMQACVKQVCGVHGGLLCCTQNLLKEHEPPAQSAATAHDAPPGSPQLPAVHTPVAQPSAEAHAAQRCVAQRPLMHAASSAQASPIFSLHRPAPHVPLKQSEFCVHASPKCPLPADATQLAVASQTALMVHMFFVSSTPAGRPVHVPTLPGIRQELQRAVQVAAQPGWHKSGVPEQLPLAQSPATLHFCCGPAALHVAPHEPPQSTSVSSASSRPSEQCVAMHWPMPLQTKPPLSLHAVPSATLLTTQLWLVGSQPTVWQVVLGAGQSFAALVHAATPPPTPPLAPPALTPPALTPPAPDSPAPPTLEVPAPGPPAGAAPACAEPALPPSPEPDIPALPFEVAVKVEPLHAVNTSTHAAAHAKIERNRISQIYHSPR
jgi:hypothetical protein